MIWEFISIHSLPKIPECWLQDNDWPWFCRISSRNSRCWMILMLTLAVLLIILFLTREWGGVNKGCLNMLKKHAGFMGWYASSAQDLEMDVLLNPVRSLALSMHIHGKCWICQGAVDTCIGEPTAAVADYRQPKLPPSSNGWQWRSKCFNGAGAGPSPQLLSSPVAKGANPS